MVHINTLSQSRPCSHAWRIYGNTWSKETCKIAVIIHDFFRFSMDCCYNYIHYWWGFTVLFMFERALSVMYTFAIHTCAHIYLLYQKKCSENIENKSSKFMTIGIKVLVTSSNPMKKCQCQTKQLLVSARHWYGLLHPLWDIPALAKWCHWWCASESVVVSLHVVVTEQMAAESSGLTC